MNKEEKVIPENNCCTGFVQSLDRMHKMRDMAEQLGLHEYVEAFKLGGGMTENVLGVNCAAFYFTGFINRCSCVLQCVL